MRIFFRLGIALMVFITTLPSFLEASQTMTLEEEYDDGDQKICVYSNGRHMDTIYKDGAGSCPSKHIKR